MKKNSKQIEFEKRFGIKIIHKKELDKHSRVPLNSEKQKKANEFVMKLKSLPK